MTEYQADTLSDDWNERYGHLMPPVWPPVEKPLTYRDMHARAVEPLRIRTMLYERDYKMFPVVPKVKTGKFADFPPCVQDFINEQDALFFASRGQTVEF